METPRVLIRPAPPYEPPAIPSPPREPALATPPARARGRALTTATVEARQFAIATVSLVLEVLDRRRGLGQLDGRVVPMVVEQIVALSRAMGEGRSVAAPPATAAGVRRVHVQMCGPGAAEIFGNYRRGERVRAFAGRIEQLPCRIPTPTTGARSVLPRVVEYRWQLVAFAMV
ncbi:Rv3235 family protein [Gordonia sp. NPDC003424]